MNNPFNRLTDAEAERLAVLAEECGEITQAACKILRHGYESVNPNLPPEKQETNRVALEREIADLSHHLKNMGACGDINFAAIVQRVQVGKPDRGVYMHHQRRPSYDGGCGDPTCELCAADAARARKAQRAKL